MINEHIVVIKDLIHRIYYAATKGRKCPKKIPDADAGVEQIRCPLKGRQSAG